MDKIRNIMSVQDEDYDNDVDYDSDLYESDRKSYSRATQQDDYSSYSKSESGNAYPADKKNKVVNIHGTNQLQVVLVKPERFEDATSIADHLNAKRTVVLNLEAASREVTRRLVDFLSGVAYANNGQMKRVANSTFIVTPFNVDIMGDLILDEMENNGMYV